MFTYNVLLNTHRLESFTVYNLLYCVSQHIWYTWDHYLPPSSMDIRWQDETGDTFACRNEHRLVDLLHECRPHWLEGQDAEFFFQTETRPFRSHLEPFIVRMSCHEAFPIATCFLKFKKFLALGFRTFKFCRSFVFSYLITSSALGSSCTMTKRDSSFAGITYPSSSMSMPRRLSWRSRGHGQSSSTAAPSDSLHPSRSDSAPQAGPSISPTGSGEYTPHYGYSSANLATPIPSPADHQAPILPNPTGETYPLQHEMEEVRRQLHAYYFVEVQSPSDDNTQPALRRLMVTEVDRRGNHHNRQPEYFFNGIIGHIRAGQNGWIDSWDQSSQLANYWRRYFQIPEISPYGNWHPHQDEAPGSPDSVHESGMDDTDSIIANVDINPPPVQIHQLATFLWNILNNDREANMAILERLEDTEGDLSRHPVQIFSAADLAHLASHLAESTRTVKPSTSHGGIT